MQRVMETGRRCKVRYVRHNSTHDSEWVSVKGFPVSGAKDKRYLDKEIARVVVKPDKEKIKSLKTLEAEYIARLLDGHNGNRRKVVGILNVSERTRYREMVSHNLMNVDKKM